MSFLFFFLALGVVFFLPGWAILSFVERKQAELSPLEKYSLAIGVSIVTVDFVMILLGVAGVPLIKKTLLLSILLPSFLLLFFAWRTKKIRFAAKTKGKKLPMSLLFLFAALVVVKTVFFLPNVLPNSTDLGHHMYWVKKIVLDKALPVYEEREIIRVNDHHQLTDPKPISDFIIGEHLPLAAVQMISGMDFDSSFSMLSLFVIHLLTMLAVYVLARRLFTFSPLGETAALLALFLIGVLYAIGPPQMKYVLGGVVGNTIGNLLIPSIFFFALLAMRTKQPTWFVVAIFLMFGLGYTHHLSSLLFAIAAVGGVIGFALFNREMFRKNIFPLFRCQSVLLAIAAATLFFFFVYTPSYIENAAVESVVGAPENTEHLGYTFSQLKFAVGEPRMILGLLGIVLLLAIREFRRTEAAAILPIWSILLSLPVLFPNVMHIDLPSGRIANYLILPLSLLAAFGVAWLFETLGRQTALPRWMRLSALFLVLGILTHNGFSDNAVYLDKLSENYSRTIALADASIYLATHIPTDTNLVHDHINIPGDAWIKLAFMRDYNYPFYRAHLFRYDRVSDRNERCTLLAISTPNTEEAKRCMRELGIGAVFVNEALDGAQFQHFGDYARVYADPYFSAYLYYAKQ